MPLEPTSKHHTSIAGEFAVLSQLALRGYDASLTVGSTKSVDILVSQPDGPMLALLLEEFGEFQQGGEGERAALVRLCRIWSRRNVWVVEAGARCESITTRL